MSLDHDLPSLENSDRHRFLVNSQWLMRLRWVAVVGQLATVAIVSGVFQVALSLPPVLAIIGLTAISNGVFLAWLTWRRRSPAKPIGDGAPLLAGIMGFDLCALTGLLYFSGGPSNPFMIFYFVNLALSAIVLPARWGWSLTVLAVCGMVVLFLFHRPVSELDATSLDGYFGLGLQRFGWLVALVTCPGIVMYFITRVTRELRQRENELRVAAQERARSERLEALGTLAAGAAHELATPLSTIAVIAKELSRAMERVTVPDSVRGDVTQIREEVDICRTILNRMRGGAGQTSGEPVMTITARQLMDEVLSGLHHGSRVDCTFEGEAGERSLRLPVQSVSQAIRGVIQNGLDASPADARVTLRVSQAEPFVHIEVQDQGTGMSNDVLQRAGEPFFTTKEPGRGMGLGLFLTRSVLERIGGTLQLESRPGAGTTAILCLRTERPA